MGDMSLKKPGGSLKVILFSSTQYNSLVVTDEEIIFLELLILPDGSSLTDAHVAFRCSYRRIPVITGPLKITATLACLKFS